MSIHERPVGRVGQMAVLGDAVVSSFASPINQTVLNVCGHMYVQVGLPSPCGCKLFHLVRYTAASIGAQPPMSCHLYIHLPVLYIL